MNTIKAKLLTSVVAGIFVILIGAFVAMFTLNGLANSFDRVIKQELNARKDINLVLSDFKTQVQEWKNVLIRGNDPKQLKKYFERFEKQEKLVQEQTASLIQRQYVPLQIRKQLEEFKTEHVKLGELYRVGFEQFKMSGFNTQAGDKAVQGIDRASGKLLKSLSAAINKEANKTSKQLSDSASSLIWITVLLLLLVMAATLARIKSRMLLPSDEDEEEEGVDPRAELVQRLLEYQRFKEAAETLSRRRLLGRDVWSVVGPGPEKTPESVYQLG